MQAVAPVIRATLVTCEYNPRPVNGIAAGLAWAILHDNNVLAWLVDETGAKPVMPVILGSIPPVAPVTTPVVSPQWAVRENWEFMIPDTMRGNPGDLFTFLAGNNGAQRPLYANFNDVGLINDFNTWARAHPTLALSTPPNL